MQNWRTVETDKFVDGWHIDMICEHLEAALSRQIFRLLITIPPRHMKSNAVSVFFPAWAWLHKPSERFLYSSYAASLSIRDSVKSRRIIQSKQYERMCMQYQPDMVLVGDQNAKEKYENSLSGGRIATSVDGSNTGEGGGIIVVDDPHNVKEVESDVKRQSVLDWWDLVMTTRLNDPKTSVFIIVMQRSHHGDLAGHVLEEKSKWTHVCLPARYEGRCRVVSNLKFNEDPRMENDEPLWPERFGDAELADIESKLGPYGVAGQLQQRPSPRGGGLFKVDKIMFQKDCHPKTIKKVVRYWDKAGTEGGGARTAGIKMAELTDGSYIFLDVISGQWSAGPREQKIKATAELDGEDVLIWTEQEPGSGGKESAEATVRNLRGFTARADKVSKSKESRAEPLAAQMEIGNVRCLVRDWTKGLVQELEMFPVGHYRDKADGSSGAFNKLHATEDQKRAGVWGRESSKPKYKPRTARRI